MVTRDTINKVVLLLEGIQKKEGEKDATEKHVRILTPMLQEGGTLPWGIRLSTKRARLEHDYYKAARAALTPDDRAVLRKGG